MLAELKGHFAIKTKGKIPVPWGVLVVVVIFLWMTWLVSRSFFFVDDFLDFATAKQMGLDWQYLSASLFGHFLIGFRLVDWLIEHFAPFHYGLLTGIELTFYGLGVILVDRLLRLLFGRSRSLSGLTVLYASSVILVPTMLWWSSFLETIPATIAALLSIYQFVRYVETKRLSHLVLLLTSYCLGLLFYETTLLIPLVLVLFYSLFLSDSFSNSGMIRSILRQWRAWVVFFVPSVIYLAYYHAHGYSSGSPRPTLATSLATFGVAWLQGFGPTTIGVESFTWFNFSGHLIPIVVAQIFLVILAIVLSLWGQGRPARAAVFFCGSFILELGPFAFVRSGSAGSGVGRDYLYLTALPWLFILAIGLAAMPLSPEIQPKGLVPRNYIGDALPQRRQRAVLVLLGVLFAGLSIHSGLQLLRSSGGYAMRNYMRHFDSSVNSARVDKGNLFVFNSPLPGHLYPTQLYPWNRLSVTIGNLAPSVHFGWSKGFRATGYLAETDGTLVPARFVPASGIHIVGQLTHPASICLSAHLLEISVKAVLDHPLPPGQWSIEIRISGEESGDMSVAYLTNVNGHLLLASPMHLPKAGISETELPMGSLSDVYLNFPAGGGFCANISVGQPIFSDRIPR